MLDKLKLLCYNKNDKGDPISGHPHAKQKIAALLGCEAVISFFIVRLHYAYYVTNNECQSKKLKPTHDITSSLRGDSTAYRRFHGVAFRRFHAVIDYNINVKRCQISLNKLLSIFTAHYGALRKNA